MEKFSVCMSVYKNDNAADFETAVYSIYNQTIPPDEIVLVIDGPISVDLWSSVNKLKDNISILRVISFVENRGHAAARQGGVDNSSYELVAIMDSDDVAEPTRFEKQLKFMEAHSEIAVMGSLIHEFIGDTQNVVGTRLVPEMDDDIKDYLKERCPMNLQTVMFRKSAVMKVGGFIDWYCEEDYYLWIRLAIAGYKFYNSQESFVNVRVGKEMYQRRGGKKYFHSEAQLQKYMYGNKLITMPRYLYNVAIRFIVQVLLPNSVRGWVFRKFARS